MLVAGSFGVLILAWSHVLAFLLWYSLRVFSILLFCPTDRLGSLVFRCRTSEDFIADCNMDCAYGGWPMKAAFDDTFYMRPSNNINQDTLVDLTTLGVVELDTPIMPDVFGLRAFDSREPVV